MINLAMNTANLNLKTVGAIRTTDAEAINTAKDMTTVVGTEIRKAIHAPVAREEVTEVMINLAMSTANLSRKTVVIGAMIKATINTAKDMTTAVGTETPEVIRWQLVKAGNTVGAIKTLDAETTKAAKDMATVVGTETRKATRE